MKQMKRDEQGEIMLESMLALLVTLFVLFFLISLGFLYYQQWMVQTAAEDAANKIAETYSCTATDPIIGYTDVRRICDRKLYRYMANKESIKNKNKKMARQFAVYRLKKGSLARQKAEPDIKVEVKDDNLARRHITVEITCRYEIFLGDFLEIFQIKKTRMFKGYGQAECLDLIDYVNTTDYFEQMASLKWTGSKIVEMINSVIKLFER